MDNRNDVWRGVDTIKPRFIELSDRVWAMPEVCYTEARSSAEHLAELRHQGFRITENLADIPTAVMGEWGEGGPVIAFLGEYDALPGLSQEAGVAEPRPVESGGHGHGCGHNLLGSSALLAATAIKDYLARHKASAANGAEPDRWASAVTYASLQMLQQAIERVGKVDRAAVIKDLQTGTFDTVIGKVKLENNMPTRFWWVGQWQDGEFYGIAPSGNEGARSAVVPKPAWVAP